MDIRHATFVKTITCKNIDEFYDSLLKGEVISAIREFAGVADNRQVMLESNHYNFEKIKSGLGDLDVSEIPEKDNNRLVTLPDARKLIECEESMKEYGISNVAYFEMGNLPTEFPRISVCFLNSQIRNSDSKQYLLNLGSIIIDTEENISRTYKNLADRFIAIGYLEKKI